MNETPKSLRIQIGVFGRTNSGKSSFINLLTGQSVSIVSDIEGTTTDIVEKSFELLPIGPVTFLDTAGLNDYTELGQKRIERTKKIYDRADVFVLVTTGNTWGEVEEDIIINAKKRNKPVIIVVNKIDLYPNNIKEHIKEFPFIEVNSNNYEFRSKVLDDFKNILKKVLPTEFISQPILVGDLVKPGGLLILIVPIDLQAPKGRLILPQVQTIRDALDNDFATLVVKEREYRYYLETLNVKPDLVVCDSQIVLKMMADTPRYIKSTTFSILFARYKGDLKEYVKGALAIDDLKDGDNVLIAEACSHHALEDDIGRVKIPRWLRQYTGVQLNIDVVSGRDYPADLEKYKLIIHCGSCMLTRNETLMRILRAKQKNVPITNYGIAISYLQGVLERAIEPFPGIYSLYKRIKNKEIP